jgi:hypothetical protein
MDFMRVLVDEEVTEVQRGSVDVQLRQIGTRTSQDRFNSCRDFAQRERLHDVVVGAEFQSGNAL